MITLYVKTHKVTGLKYLGKTEKDPYTYSGSGIRWKRELNKYGNDVETEILFQSESFEDIREKGLYYSELWNIVESDDWSNLIEENGSGGDTSAYRDYEEMSRKTKGISKGSQSEQHRINNSLAHIGQTPWNKGKKPDLLVKKLEKNILYLEQVKNVVNTLFTKSQIEQNIYKEKKLVACAVIENLIWVI